MKKYHVPTEDKRMVVIAAIVGFVMLSCFVWDHTILTSLEIMVENFLSIFH
jgi:hypothetical protein